MALTDLTLRDAIQAFVDYAIAHGLVERADTVWLYNRVLACVGATGPGPCEAWLDVQVPAGELAGESAGELADELAGESAGATPTLDELLALFGDAACARHTITDTASERDRLAMEVMGLVVPRPSQVAAEFYKRYEQSGAKAATSWFYQLCCDVNYVRRSAIARNIEWHTPTQWGNLEITINLSKPEKDPRDIAAAASSKAAGETYPACQLCVQNEGYAGRPASDNGGHPARQNLRIIPLELNGEPWGFQYSPYAYFSEHCIVMAREHRPMHIDAQTFSALLDFVDMLPNYFIGSNADLPIVGGSILSHDHFQGGAHEFPMMRAAVASEFELAAYPSVHGEVLKWPLSVLRLRGSDRAALLDACTHVFETWDCWDDAQVGIVSHAPDGTRHNTITPVFRRLEGQGSAQDGAAVTDGVQGAQRTDDGAGTQDVRPQYEAYLALRCNITSENNPLGDFHPHAQWHHIKKENIGLIEVMGLAILPGRLVHELSCIEQYFLRAKAGEIDLAKALTTDEATRSHAAWALDVFERRSAEIGPQNTSALLQDEVGHVFAHVLEDAGVFKWDKLGRAALQRFIDAL